MRHRVDMESADSSVRTLGISVSGPPAIHHWIRDKKALALHLQLAHALQQLLTNGKSTMDLPIDSSKPQSRLILLQAGMKAGVKLGYSTSSYWAFGIDDVIDCIVRQGPILLGISWFESMSNPDSDGFIPVDFGGSSSGHCIMANGYWPRHPDFGDVIVLTNTWGSDWGLRGRGYIHVSALGRLLQMDGEAVKPHDVAIEPPHIGGTGADHLFDSE